MKTQKQRVLEIIQKEGGITRASAAKHYIFELSARIIDLEREGWTFKRTPLKGKRYDGSRWRIIRYSDPQRGNYL